MSIVELPKFYVSRTSIMWGENNKPCEEAVWDSIEREWYLPSFCMNDLGWFCLKYKSIILEPYKDGYDLEIYDDYRE